MKFMRFCVVGGLGFVTNIIIFKICLVLNFHALIASFLAFICALSQNYILNHNFTFRVKNKANLKKYSIFFALSLITLGINLSILSILKNFIDVLLAQIMGIFCGVIFNFIFSNFIVFREKK